MEKIRDIVIQLPPDNKQKIFYDFRTNLQLNWAEMEEVVQYIRRTKQIQVSLIQQMPFQAQLRLACYLLYDEINPPVFPPVVEKVKKLKKGINP
jgi:hypothetical protein